MGKNTLGQIKNFFTIKSYNSFINEDKFQHPKGFDTFIKLISENDILKQEYKFLRSIENKQVSSRKQADSLLDKWTRVFENYEYGDFEKAHNNLNTTISLDETQILIPIQKLKLYEAINNLIKETTKETTDVDVDSLHEACETIIDHLLAEKKSPTTFQIPTYTTLGSVIKESDKLYKESLKQLNEDTREAIITFVNCSEKTKTSIFETLQNEVVTLIKEQEIEDEDDSVKLDHLLEHVQNVDTSDLESSFIQLLSLKENLIKQD